MGINWGDIGSNITNFGGKIGETLISPNPVIKLITNPQKAIEQPETLLPAPIRPLGNDGPIKPADEWKTVAEDAGNTLLAPNPLISAVTGNAGDILQTNKPASEKWENVSNTVTETVNNTTETVKETVKETIQNVTKGVGSALPVLAIGGAAILGLSLLFGRR